MADKLDKPAGAAMQPASAEESAPGGTRPVRVIVGAIIALIAVLVVGFIVAFMLAFASPGAADGVRLVRDFFIIALALEGMLMGAALIILVLQIARLTNLLQNEIKPILEQTNDTVRTVKGTANFVTRNVAEPVIKASGFVAGAGAFLHELVSTIRSIR
jgi:hypothetical protein